MTGYSVTCFALNWLLMIPSKSFLSLSADEKAIMITFGNATLLGVILNPKHGRTRVGVSKTLCPQHLLVPKYGRICSVVIPQNFLDFAQMFSSSHAVRDLGRVRQYPPWLLFAAFVESVGCPRYNPQKTRKQ